MKSRETFADCAGRDQPTKQKHHVRREERESATLTLSIWSISDLPGKSGSLDSSSAMMHPSDHMSMAVEYSLEPSSSSGAL